MDERMVGERAGRLAVLGDPVRLRIVDELVGSDRSPRELGRLLGVASNLLAHHLDALERVGLIERSRSSGDGRRRYVHLRPNVMDDLLPRASVEPGVALFVCTANSARSQLAASLWTEATGAPASSAGTHPAERIHPGAVAAGERAGLDLCDREPQGLQDLDRLPPLVVTVCDRAHEELHDPDGWLHWSVPDPVPAGTPDAFDAAVDELRARISTAVGSSVPRSPEVAS